MEPWYDPTASRRDVREADRLRLASNPNGTPDTPPSSSTPAFSGLNQPQDDFIDMPVSNNNTPTAAISTTPPVESPNHSQYHHTVTSQHISDEDLSLHGSSVMDETEDNERGLGQIMDGYDFLSSADSDIELTDQQPPLDTPTPSPPPPIILPSSSSFTESSYLSSQSTISNASSDAAINESISVNTDLELDERVSEPESIEIVPNPHIEPHASSPATTSTTIPATPEPDFTTIANFSSSVDSNQTPIMLHTSMHPRLHSLSPQATFAV